MSRTLSWCLGKSEFSWHKHINLPEREKKWHRFVFDFLQCSVTEPVLMFNSNQIPHMYFLCSFIAKRRQQWTCASQES